MELLLKGFGNSLRKQREMHRVSMAALLALVLSLAAIPATFASPQGATQEVAARWEGTVQIPGAEMVVVIDLMQDSKGAWTGSAIVPGFGIKGAPLADITIKDSDLAFAIKGAMGDPKFKGRINGAGNLEGEFEQGGNTAPFALHKTGPPQVEPQPHSTPVGKELEGEWQGNFELIGKKLHALITLTNQAGGAAAAQFQIKGEIETKVPIDLVTNDGGLLTLETPRQSFIYQGQYSKDLDEIKGTIQF